MKALILAGGKGNRVSPVYKPLVCILGKPIIDILLNQLKDFDVYMNINKDSIDKLKNYKDKINFIIEEKREGKSQPVRDFAEKYNEDFIVIHCDVYSDFDFKGFIEKTKDNKELMTMVVKNISKGKAFGVAVFDEHKKVYGFTRERYVNTGIYLVRPGIKDYIKKDIYQDLDKDTFPKLIKDSQLKVYIHNGFWWDMGTQRVISKFNKEKKK